MRTMAEFYRSDLVTNDLMAAHAEHARLRRILEEEPTEGEEIPAVIAATTHLRDLLE